MYRAFGLLQSTTNFTPEEAATRLGAKFPGHSITRNGDQISVANDDWEIELLLKVGEYKKGSDPTADVAIEKHDAIRKFLRQKTDEHVDWETSLAALRALAS